MKDIRSLGRQASSRLLDKQFRPSESVSSAAAVTAGTLVIRIQRARTADNAPLYFDETWLPREIGERILENDLEYRPLTAEACALLHSNTVLGLPK